MIVVNQKGYWTGKVRDDMREEKHFAWKGDNVGRTALHDWVKSRLGSPSKCEHCSSTTAKRFEWANKSHKYKRELTDWLRLCTKCHYDYDKPWIKAWKVRRERLATGELKPIPYKNIWNGRVLPKSKLKLNQVEEIRVLLRKGMMCKDIAPLFNISKQTISQIKTGRAWKIGVHI